MFIFMLVSALLTPTLLVVIAFVWRKTPPANINTLYGYRTPMSTKNKETWDFAHKLCAKILLWGGIPNIVATAFIMFLFREQSEIAGTIIVVVQLIEIFVMAIFVEKALAKRFDEEGNLRA